MRQFLIPLIVFAILAVVYLAISGAPQRVHVLSIAVLFLGIPVSVWVCTAFSTKKARMISAVVSANLVGLCWDSTAYFVLSKGDFLFMLRFNPWLYLIISVLLGTVIYVLAVASSPYEA
jgi:Mn2+/Fe2+ NRAMP family transporter